MNTESDARQQRAIVETLVRDDAVAWAVEALIGRRGMLRIVSEDTGGEILDAIADRLPSSYRWCVATAPRTPEAVWSALFEGALPAGEEPGLPLREILWQRSRAGVGTVLGITETATVPDEVLSVLEELAGMEPMLQIVIVSDAGSTQQRGEAAARLAVRVRAHAAVEFAQPIPVVERRPAALAEPHAARPAALPAERSGTATARSAAVAPLEAASQRTFDPFRGNLVRPSIDTPQLLPVLSDPHGLHTEWFRVLRLRLEDWIKAQGPGPKVIAISGAEAGAGKTFVAANLALLWANSTFERVLLVDGDLRQPQLQTLFEIPQRPGLADVLARRFPAQECITFVKEVGLDVMPAGRAGSPRQLVNPDRVERVIAAFKSTHEVVILDGPPLIGMVDARSFAAACDGTLLVVRSGQTRLRSLQKAMAELPPDRLIGAVVNGAATRTESAYTRYRDAVRS